MSEKLYNNLIKLLSSIDEKSINLALTIINKNQDICRGVLLLLKNKILLYEWCENLDISEENNYKISYQSKLTSKLHLYSGSFTSIFVNNLLADNSYNIYINNILIGTLNLSCQ